MSELTTEALARWGTIDGLLAKAPKAASQGAELFSKDWVPDFCKGIGWLVSVLWDVQTNYGDSILWPLAKGPVRDIVLLNAAAALLAYRGISTVRELLEQLEQPLADAKEAIDSGRAAATLDAWIAATWAPISQRTSPAA